MAQDGIHGGSTPRVYVCVECGADVPLLVRDYGKGNVRLAICERCNAVADPYVEYDHILLFLEALLLKPQVYRHVLYNLAPSPEPRTLLKLFLILSLLDMNVKAYLIDRRRGVSFRAESLLYHQDDLDRTSAISGLRVGQYSLHLVCMSLLENAVLVVAIFAMICLDPFRRGWSHYLSRHAVAATAANTQEPLSVWSHLALTRYATAMCISSFGKMFAMLTVIWEFHWTFVHVIGAIVVCSNALALQLLLGERPYAPAVLALVVFGFGMRFLSQVTMYALGNPTLFYVFA